MRRLSPLSILPVLLCAWPCLAQYESQEYLPLTKAETARRFRVKLLGETGGGRPGYFGRGSEGGAAPARLNVGPKGASFEADEEGRAVVSGKDKRGGAWRVRLGTLMTSYAARLYAADLDRNGIQDLFIVAPTGGNGLAPTSHFYALTFDAEGRPVPFEADGYFEEDKRGLFDLLDLDGDGRAELLYMNFDDGYWVTTLYEAEGGRWRHVTGRHGRRTYPLYTRFTNRPNRTPTRPKPGRNPFTPDLSNVAPALRGTLASYEWAEESQGGEVTFNVSGAGGARVACKPDVWFGSFGVVADSREGREVVTAYGNEAAAKALLDEAVKAKSEVTLYGRRAAEGCSPEWVWVRR